MKKADVRIGLVVLCLIVLPSGLLAYFSWRALESEKLLARERLEKSYDQLVQLAARSVNEQLTEVESRWGAPVDALLASGSPAPTAAELSRLVAAEDLIAEAFLLTAPGEVVYPPDVSLTSQRHPAESEGSSNESLLRDQERLDRRVATGEEQEYETYDLPGAVATYRALMEEVENPQFKAMALSYIGRVQMKQGHWEAALASFRSQLRDYPEMRDLNKMYLRFVAQLQIASCLENLGRDQEAVDVLLALNEDLLQRSDAINVDQYSFFTDQLRSFAVRLFSSPDIADVERYRSRFDALAEQNKKRIGDAYVLQLLDRQLYKMVIKRKRVKDQFYYISDQADDEPVLLAYRGFPDSGGTHVGGLVGLQIDLAQLRSELFPTILSELRFSDEVELTILDQRGNYVLASAHPATAATSEQALASPFEFWYVALHPQSDQPAGGSSFQAVLGVWLISLLLLSIVLGAVVLIRRARREARLSKMKTSFVSRVSHELRTPLASIKMMAELMEMRLARRAASDQAAFEAEVRQYLGVIQRECGRLGRLIETVLDFSKSERDAKQFRFEYEDAEAVLRTAVDSFRPQLESRGFAVSLELAPDLPELLIDADAISQVVLNLLSNAAHYSDQVKEIQVRARREGDAVCVAVSDRGIGIDPSQTGKIFEEFYRVDQSVTSDQQQGLGLGLTLARHIIEAHGGRITVDSNRGEGSTFTFTLPVPEEITATEGMAMPSQAVEVQPLRES